LPFVYLNESPLLPGISPVRIYYREEGDGVPLIFLHSGWGYASYPFDSQINEFSDSLRILIPDRSGYGRSMQLNENLSMDFHKQAAAETIKFLDALNIEHAVLWGHSDGAVIAAMMGLSMPKRILGLILEAFHYYRAKRSSRDFYATLAFNPQQLGEKICKKLELDHGGGYWQKIIKSNGYIWLKFTDESENPKEDLYKGELKNLAVPTIFIHGSLDPRTEPDELVAVHRELPLAPIHIIEGARHSPHSEHESANKVNQIATDFLQHILGVTDNT